MLIKPSLEELIAEEEQKTAALYRPLEGGTRFDLAMVLARVRAGARHLTGRNLEFLARQIFPSSADTEYLREFWRDRVAPLEASYASGEIELSGLKGTVVPAGLLWKGQNGKFYRQNKQVALGNGLAEVEALEPGSSSNLSSGELKLASSLISGLSPKALAVSIRGGSDAESDEAYRVRIEVFERQGVRIGRSGDWAAWARDASSEVSQAWEFANHDEAGSILIQVISGSQEKGISAVEGLEVIKSYIAGVAPTVLVEVRSPQIVAVNMQIQLLPAEDSSSNRQLVTENLKTFWALVAKPESTISTAQVRAAVEDGKLISSSVVKLSSEILSFSKFQIPTQGAITWN